MATTTSFRSPPPMAHKRAKFSIDSLMETKEMRVQCEGELSLQKRLTILFRSMSIESNKEC
jgi:hypothetical protein